jgi:NAD(P)-dependent dehydrogenase (short-subunit alcohol dehydrogenase family)
MTRPSATATKISASSAERSMDDLSGRVAFITGGASGIGAATARRLAAEGCRVVIADVQSDLGQGVAAEVQGRLVRLDVTDPAAWATALDEVAATEGTPDLVLLNAGVTTGEGELANLTDQQYARIIGVNINGVVFGARAAAAKMAGRGGTIVATASLAGLIGFAPDPIYTLTKHAVIGFVRAVAPQLELQGITINAVCPGVVDTPLVGDEGKSLLEAAGVPLIPAAQIAEAVVGAVRSGRTGEAWTCLPGRPAEVFNFPEIGL